MRIARLDLIAFGGFTETTLDFSAAPRPFHLIYGPNESGKSTCLRAIIGWLFGIDHLSSDDYLHPYRDLRIGGILNSPQLGELSCVRRKGKSGTLLTADQGDVVDPTRLDEFLGSTDKASFLRAYGLDRDRLRDGGDAIIRGEGDLGEILFAAGAGVERLGELKKALEERCEELYTPKATKRKLNELFGELKELREELQAKSLSTRDFEAHDQALSDAHRRVDELRKNLRQNHSRLTDVQNLLKAQPLAVRVRGLTEQLATLENVPELDPGFAERRRELSLALARSQQEHKTLAKQIEQCQQQRKQLGDAQPWLAFEQIIESLADQAPLRRNDVNQWHELQRRQEGLEHEVRQLSDLLKSSGIDAQSPPTLSPQEEANLQSLEEEFIRSEENLRQAEETREQNRRQWESAREQSAALTQGDDPNHLGDLLAAGPDVTTLGQQLEQANEAVDQLSEECKLHLKRLHGFRGSLDDAAQLVPPAAAEIEHLGNHLRTAKASNEQAEAEVTAAERRLQELDAQLAGFTQTGRVPSEQELTDAREHRDAGIQGLIAADSATPRDEIAENVRIAVRQADDLADAMRRASDQVAQREQLHREHETQKRQLIHLQTRRQQADAKLREAKQSWDDLWQSLGVQPSDSESMRGWLERHEALLRSVTQRGAAEAKYQRIQKIHAQRCESLQRALGDLGQFVDATTDLRTLHQTALRTHQQLADARQRWEHATEREKQLREELDRYETQMSELSERREDWQLRWNEAVADWTDQRTIDPRALRQTLKTSRDLSDQRRRLEEVETRRTSVQRDLVRFVQETEQARSSLLESGVESVAVGDSVDPESFAADATDATDTQPVTLSLQRIDQWKHQLQEAREQAQQRQALNKQFNALQESVAAAEFKIEQRETELNALCDEVGCSDPESLPDLEQKSHEKMSKLREREDLQRQLSELSGGAPLASYLESALEADQSALRQEQNERQQQIDETERELEQGNQELGKLQAERQSMNGSGHAADINQKIEDRLAKARRWAHEYLVLKLQSSSLDRAMEKYREANQGPIVQRAQDFFQQLTCGNYSRLRPQIDDRGQRVLRGQRTDNQQWVPAPLMSEGTADALFLALRLASMEHSLQVRGPLPLILDDVLVQFDDDRCQAALRIFAELAQQTQVIFFTHHQHLVQLAESTLNRDEYQLLRLDSSN